MAATVHDVARLAGVSIKTVSNVVNDYPHIRPATKQRVLDAIDELGYRPNLSARSLRSGRSGVISLIIPGLRHAYFAELADEVMLSAAQRGITVLIQQVGGDRESELAALRGPRTQSVDGILFSVLELGQEDAPLLEDISLPLVLLGERIFHSGRDHVTMQNEAAARAATEHLLTLGRRRILAVGAHPGEVIGSAGLRLEGYRQAIDAAGLPVDAQLIRPTTTWHRADGARAMREILDQEIDFDAVFAFNDTLALGAMRVLQESGRRVPDDVAVIGFDDIDETRYTLPTLSTVDPGRQEIARTAVSVLLERIAGTAPTEPREIETAFRIIQRESTSVAGPVPASDRKLTAGTKPGIGS